VPIRLPLSSIPCTLDHLQSGFLFSHAKEVCITTRQDPACEGDSEEVEVVKVERVKKEGKGWVDAREWWNGMKRSVEGGKGVQLE